MSKVVSINSATRSTMAISKATEKAVDRERELLSASIEFAQASLDETRLTKELKECRCTKKVGTFDDNCLTHHFALGYKNEAQVANLPNLCESCSRAMKVITLRLGARSRQGVAKADVFRLAKAMGKAVIAARSAEGTA
jgi:hypothetical protein